MSKLKTKWIEDGAVTNAKLNADVAGVGLTGGAGSALAVDFQDDEALTFGTGNDSVIEFDTGQTNDMLLLALDATSRSMVVCEEGDRGFNFAHSAQTNPTVFVHSVNQSTTEWLSLAHDQTDGILSAGTGVKITTGNNGDLKLIPNGTGITIIGDAGSPSNLGSPTNDDFFVSGRLEVDGAAYFDNTTFHNAKVRVLHNYQLTFGSGDNAHFEYDTGQTNNALLLGVCTTSRSLVVHESGDQGFDFAHSVQTNPTIFLQSANQSTTEWMSLTHDQTYGRISTGAGSVAFGSEVTSHSLNSVGDVICGALEANSNSYIDATLFVSGVISVGSGSVLWAGSSSYGAIQPRNATQTPDTLFIGVGSASNHMIVAEYADNTYDFAHAVQTNPTIFVHSANQSTTEWLSLAHDQTDGVIDTGTGAIKMNQEVKFQDYLQLTDITAPANPGAGLGRLYKKTGNDGLFWLPDAAGPEVDLTAGGTPVYGDDTPLNFGASDDAAFEWNTDQTNDAFLLGLSGSNSFIICEKADMGTNFGKSNQTNPTLYVQSADAATVNDYISLSHDQTDGIIDVGTGNIKVGSDIDLNENSIRLDPSPGTNQTGHGLIIIATVTTNTQGFGGQLTVNSSWQWVDANAGDYTTMPALATALDSGTGSGKRLLLHGVGIVRDDAWNWSRDVSSRPGFIYVSTTNGDVTQTRPSADGDEVQPVGFPLSADVMMILPCHTLVTLVI